MRAISKGSEPESLRKHRNARHSDYGNYAAKDELREALVAEQRGLCCYCMGRIRPQIGSMKIEHWQSQASRKRQLDYGNLLGACLGGEGQPGYLQHCDTRKGDRNLRWNPADPLHYIEERIRYESDGLISADDVDFNQQLNEVLNLNLRLLRNNRKGVLLAVLDWWKNEKHRIRGPVPRKRFLGERDKHVSGTGELRPYSQVAVWWLDQRLAKMTT